MEVELLPKPLNFIMCGMVDVEHPRIKPDREGFVKDDAYQSMIKALEGACGDVLRTLVERSPEKIDILFRDYRTQLLDSMKIHDFAREALVTLMPLALWGEEEPVRFGDYLQQRDGRVVWTQDAEKERTLLDRASQLYGPVLQLEKSEVECVKRYCRDKQIPFIGVAEEYVESLKHNAVSSHSDAGLIALQSLFRSIVDQDVGVMLVRDSDRRFPVQVVTLLKAKNRSISLEEMVEKDGELGFLFKLLARKLDEDFSRGEEETVLVVNLNNPIIQSLKRELENAGQAAYPELRRAAHISLFLAQLVAGHAPEPAKVKARIEEIWDLIQFRLTHTP